MRTVNEDAFFLGRSLFAVADGMGGHRAGDRASALAIEHVSGAADSVTGAEDVLAAVCAANDAIVAESDHLDARQGMGTTLVGLSLVELAGSPHWLAFNVGDSRLYTLREGRLHQVTVDHSEVQEMVDAGEISAAEAATHPQRNVITRSVGTRHRPAVDTWMLPDEGTMTFLLCSDGLTNELDEDRIAALLMSSGSPQVAADRLVEAAESAGGRDNITVVVVVSESAERARQGALEETLPRAGEVVP